MPERTFGRTIKYRRNKLGLSQAKLGELVGRSASTIRSWERDSSAPSDSTVITALSAILDIDEALLYTRAGQDPPAVETSPTIEQALASLSPDQAEQKKPAKETRFPTRQPTAYSRPFSSETYVLTAPTPPIVEPSYMEDTAQRQLYRARNLATIVILVALAIALMWALSEGLGALGAWWDEFFGNLRL